MCKPTNNELNRLTINSFQKSRKLPIVLVLDNIRSMNNVGSAFRTSDAFAIESVALCGITAQPPHREINKTALGATESVMWQYYKTTLEACHYLKSKGYLIICVEQVNHRIALQDFKPLKNQQYALVFGNEILGIEERVIQTANECIEIPQFGIKHSLNIAVSIGVVLWHMLLTIKF